METKKENNTMGAAVATAMFFVAMAVMALVVKVAEGLGYIKALNDKMEGKLD